jgi:hypothetical protein
MGSRYVLKILFGRNHKVDNNPATSDAKEKKSTDPENFRKKDHMCLTKIKNNRI